MKPRICVCVTSAEGRLTAIVTHDLTMAEKSRLAQEAYSLSIMLTSELMGSSATIESYVPQEQPQ